MVLTLGSTLLVSIRTACRVIMCCIGNRAGGGAATGHALVKKLGSRRVNHLFTHLRKIAQHPLLVRHRFSDKQVQAMARLAFSK